MSEERKKDHIALALQSVPKNDSKLTSSFYEPLFSPHPKSSEKMSINFLDFEFDYPLWVSSMTGGTEKAEKININLAMACEEFGLGMGLGSCRSLLDSRSRLQDFDVRKYMPHRPLFTNFGIAQLEELIFKNNFNKVLDVVSMLSADGIIIHVNPLQEWLQPEGDRYQQSPLNTIETILKYTDLPVIVKEVGQGFGPRSLNTLLCLPLAAIELAGYGGTNFSLLEEARMNQDLNIKKEINHCFGTIGHTCDEMIPWINQIQSPKCKNIIISGGIKNVVMAAELRSKLKRNSVIGLASALLQYAQNDYKTLQSFLNEYLMAFKMASGILEDNCGNS